MPTDSSGYEWGSDNIFAPSLKIDRIGDGAKGRIVDMQVTQQTKFGTGEKMFYSDSGKPMMQLVVILETDLRDWDKVSTPSKDEDGNPLPPSADDGKRAIYVKGNMEGAVRRAFRAAGSDDLYVGAELGIWLSERRDTGKGNPLKVWGAKYWPAAETSEYPWESSGEPAAETPAAPAPDPWAGSGPATGESNWPPERHEPDPQPEPQPAQSGGQAPPPF